MSTKPTKQAKQPKPKTKQSKPKAAKPKAAPIHARPQPAEPMPQQVATKPKPVTEAKPKRQVLKPMSLSHVITVMTPNPYRHGNKSWVSFNLYRTGMTVEEALKLGIPRDWLAWDRRYGYISVEPVPTSGKPVGKRRAVGSA